jgi:hypothetical protein
MRPADGARELWDLKPTVRAERLEFAPLPPEVKDGDLPALVQVARAEPGAAELFGRLEASFLGPGEKLRRVKGGRAAMLRTFGMHLIVLETGATWEARLLPGNGSPQQLPKALARVKELLLPGVGPAAPARGPSGAQGTP